MIPCKYESGEDAHPRRRNKKSARTDGISLIKKTEKEEIENCTKDTMELDASIYMENGLKNLTTNPNSLSTNIMNEMHLTPLHYLRDDADDKLVLIVLNQPIGPYLQILKVLWKKAIFKAATDGCINHLHSDLGETRDSYLPDIISGDFDSATPSTLEYYKGKGVEIIPTPEQDETDFTKCMRITAEKTQSMQKDAIVVLGGFGGRMDHVFANIDTLFVAKKLMPGVPVYLLSDISLVTLLEKDRETVIHVDSGYEGEWCGLIPIGCPCEHVTTSGLKWNLDDGVLKFGELISTSNTYNGSNTVSIKTKEPLLWTMGVNYRR